MRAHLLSSVCCLAFRFLVVAAGSAGVLGCVYGTTVAITFLWRVSHPAAAELPMWMPLVCIPSGALIFFGAMHIFGAIEWVERVSGRIVNSKKGA